MADNKRKALGRGLDALLEDNDTGSGGVVTLRLTQISPNRAQPRKDFTSAELEELAASISEHGVIQPIIVSESGLGYVIVAGERRWRAARMAGLSEIPALIRDYSERDIAEISLIENLQRADLNPVEEAQGYKKLMEDYGLTQEQAAVRLGVARSRIANSVRLLDLPESVLKLLREGRISTGHAKILAGLDSALAEQLAVACCDGKMSVRDLEKISKEPVKKPVKRKKPAKDVFYSEFEIAVKASVGRDVRVEREPTPKKPGLISIEFFSREDLTEFIKRLAEKGE